MDGDIAICGGGTVGSALAVLLAKRGLSVLVFDRAATSAGGPSKIDSRAFALSLSSQNLLRSIGLADILNEHAQDIELIRIHDRLPGGETAIAALEFAPSEIGVDALGCMIGERPLRNGLSDMAANQPRIARHLPAEIEGFRVEPSRLIITLASGREFAVSAVAGCDGRRGSISAWIDPPRLEKNYGQAAVVCSISHQNPHNGIARQFFMPTGPLAALPLPGLASSIVWTLPSEDAARSVEIPEADFLRELRYCTGDFLGTLELAGTRQLWPLSLSLAERMAAPRAVLVGDAAHGFHPLAGQGLNIALRDAEVLGETLIAASRRGEDIGSLAVLCRYQERRRFDAASLAAATDFFNWIYSNDSNLLRNVRNLGMRIVRNLPPIRRALIAEASGQQSIRHGTARETLANRP